MKWLKKLALLAIAVMITVMVYCVSWFAITGVWCAIEIRNTRTRMEESALRNKIHNYETIGSLERRVDSTLNVHMIRDSLIDINFKE